jgi:hypothetical protein
MVDRAGFIPIRVQNRISDTDSDMALWVQGVDVLTTCFRIRLIRHWEIVGKSKRTKSVSQALRPEVIVDSKRACG